MNARELLSAQVPHDPFAVVALVLVVAGAPVVASSTLLWLRRNWRTLPGFRAALLSSSLAALPGVALAVELVQRSLSGGALAVREAAANAWCAPVGPWGLLWPFLLMGSVGERYLQTTPKGLTWLQAGQFLLACAASALAFLYTPTRYW